MTSLTWKGGGNPYDGTVGTAPGTVAKPSLWVRSQASGFYSPTAGTLAAAIGGVAVNFPAPAAAVTLMSTAASIGTNGLTTIRVPLIYGKNSDGTTLATSASSGKFGLSVTLGTSALLLTEAANSNTKTDVVMWELVLPSTYVAASNITVTANCNYTLGSGTVGTHTLAMAAYLAAAAGTMGSTIIATAAQTVPATAGEVTFTITGTTLTPGSRIFLAATLVIQDTAGSNITAQINSVRLS